MKLAECFIGTKTNFMSNDVEANLISPVMTPLTLTNNEKNKNT